MFHEHDREVEFLKIALQTKSFYIGALGSNKTQQNRLEALRESSFGERDLARIHGPVGLDIGASSPEQIAISILAHLFQQLNLLDEQQ